MSGAKIIEGMTEAVIIAPWVAQVQDLEAEVARLREENGRLRIAFHDATRRPLGVTPDSGAEFYDPRMADEAEACRPRLPR